MGVRDNKYPTQCETCEKVELLEYTTLWYRKKHSVKNCKSCVTKANQLLGLTHKFKKGVPSWNKGLQNYGKWSKWNPKGESNPFYGRKHTSENLIKMQVAKLGKYGKEANNWRGGTTKKRKLLENRQEYKEFRKSIFQRDNYTCQICFVRGGSLELDHIKEWCNYPELRLDANNCRTLCHECHTQTGNYLEKALLKRKELHHAVEI